MLRLLRGIGTLTVAAALLGACGYADPDTEYPETGGKGNRGSHAGGYTDQGSIFGPGGLTFLGGNDDKIEPGAGAGGGIAVNSYLWRASLDTISFMPLSSADPFGGVIITDWYTPPEAQAERFKATVYILGRDLRADAVRAGIFRQVRNSDGTWVDATVEPQVSTDIENAILVRARQLRIAGLE